MSEAATDGSDLHPHGPGSYRALADDREMPPCYPIKGKIRRDGVRHYHRPDSRNYGATRAEVWFDSPSAAEAAGFALAPTHPSGADPADYEPGGAEHPCSVAQVEANRTEAAGGTARHPYGPGSHGVLASERESPACYPIKANIGNDGRRFYHRPDSRNYGATRAEVWFDSPSAAEAAGFALAPTHPSGADPADYEPGGAEHPCSVEEVGANRTAVAGLIATGFTGGPGADIDAAGSDTTDDRVVAGVGVAEGFGADATVVADVVGDERTGNAERVAAEVDGGERTGVAAGAAALGPARLGRPAADTDTHPFGVGSHATLPNAMDMPRFYPIKGNLGGDGSRRYYRPDSTLYRSTKPEVWFDSPSAAEACGFTLSATHPADGAADDYEPGGKRHPWSIEDVEGARLSAHHGPDGARGGGSDTDRGTAGAVAAGAAVAAGGAVIANRLIGGDDELSDTVDAATAAESAPPVGGDRSTDRSGAGAAAAAAGAAAGAGVAAAGAKDTVVAAASGAKGARGAAGDRAAAASGGRAAAASGGGAAAGGAAATSDDARFGGLFGSGNGERRGCMHPVWMLLSLVVLLLLLALVLSQCGGDDDADVANGGGNTTEAPDDEPSSPSTVADDGSADDDDAADSSTTEAPDLEALALAALAEAGLNDVEVEVNNGQITLTGTVDDEDDMQAAEDAVAAISGVTSVDNALQIAGAGSADAEIREAAQAALADAGYDDVEVDVSDGVVTLTGELPDEDAVAAAAAAVDGVEGASSVTNSLTVASGDDGETGSGDQTENDTEETPPADPVEQDPPFTG